MKSIPLSSNFFRYTILHDQLFVREKVDDLFDTIYGDEYHVGSSGNIKQKEA